MVSNQSGLIFSFNDHRQSIVDEVSRRVFEQKSASAEALELAINDTAFREIARLEGKKKSPELLYWQSLYATLGRKSISDQQAILKRQIDKYAEDIAGNFNPSVYRFASRIVPRLLAAIMRRQDGDPFNLSRRLDSRIRIEGEIDLLRSLAERGTVLFVPTHSSNMDSIVVGWLLYRLNMPPFTYGAGKNLFSNFLLSFFMHNLGAYKVDRRLKHTLYNDTLKMYSTVLLERGYHSIFFPGGQRNRSNMIEEKLKLGLLGTGLEAYINNLQRGKENPDIYVVPCTLNYHLVLEAETQVADYLKHLGKAQYIQEEGESSQMGGRFWKFLRGALELDTHMVVHIGQAMDVLGHRVDAEGISYDNQNRPIDLRKFVEVKGVPAHRGSRDRQYTRELGDAIVKAYHRDNVILSSHLVAFALFQSLRQQHPQLELFKLLRLPGPLVVHKSTLCKWVDRLRYRLKQLAKDKKIRLSDLIANHSTDSIVDHGAGILSMYHRTPALLRQGDEMILNDLKLLLYYQNRLHGYELEKVTLLETAPLSEVMR